MTRPVVLVHGFGTSFDATWVHNGWVDLLGDLGRRVIGVDLLGHGSAPKPHDPAAYADLTERIVDVLPDEPVDAIGFSLGAKTLLSLAGRAPDRFHRLVVSGVGANLFRSDDVSGVAAVVRGADAGGVPLLDYFAGLVAVPGSDPEALALCLEHGGPPFDPAVPARIDFPVLVALGDADFAGPADPLVDALPNSEFVMLRRTDHARTPKSFEFIDAALAFIDHDD